MFLQYLEIVYSQFESKIIFQGPSVFDHFIQNIYIYSVCTTIFLSYQELKYQYVQLNHEM